MPASNPNQALWCGRTWRRACFLLSTMVVAATLFGILWLSLVPAQAQGETPVVATSPLETGNSANAGSIRLKTVATWIIGNPQEAENTTSVAWGDVDDDGRLDLAVGN